MNSDDKRILNTIHQLQRVAGKYALIEEMPILVGNGIEVTTKEAHTIEAIGKKQPINVTEVAVEFGVSRSAASQMVAKLYAKGFLEKKFAPHSEKEFQLSLTSLGQSVFDAHAEHHGADQTFLHDRLRSFSAEELLQFSAILDAFDEVFNKRLASRVQR